MRISVRQGDVHVRQVNCTAHSRGVYLFEIKTPFDPHVHLNFGELCERGNEHPQTIVDVYAVRRDEPTRITITPEMVEERTALGGWLLFSSERSGFTVVLALPSGILDGRGGLVASWKAAPAQVDYLERLYMKDKRCSGCRTSRCTSGIPWGII